MSGAARQDGPLHPFARRTVGRVAQPFYAAYMAARNRAFDMGLGVRAAAVPVVSVGNLSVGGTGKTPMVAWVCEQLMGMRVWPAVALRGYKGDAPGGSDEAQEYALRLPGVPLAVGPDRFERIAALLAEPAGQDVTCVVLDDGFQHRRLQRDVDLVLIDASRDVRAERLLPVGWWREPLSSLARASAVVLTHSESASAENLDRLVHRVRAIVPRLPQAVCRHVWTGFDGVPAAGAENPLAWLRKSRVVVCCGIGNPDAFVRSVSRRAEVAGTMLLADHDPFTESTIGDLISLATRERADAIVVTNKDWAKLRRVKAERWPCAVVRPRVGLQFDSGEREMIALLEGVASWVRPTHSGQPSTISSAASSGEPPPTDRR